MSYPARFCVCLRLICNDMTAFFVPEGLIDFKTEEIATCNFGQLTRHFCFLRQILARWWQDIQKNSSVYAECKVGRASEVRLRIAMLRVSMWTERMNQQRAVAGIWKVLMFVGNATMR
jgi:hypothetical protein